ncbi:uncharacterized protein METZ01_LOCUS389124, partial [marine metagenome]
MPMLLCMNFLHRFQVMMSRGFRNNVARLESIGELGSFLL